MNSVPEGFSEYTDEELVAMAQNGDKNALEAVILRYNKLVYAKSKSFFLIGADDDDIIQEGFIGLYNAVKKFDGEKFPFFNVFAGLCIRRRMINAVKEASRKKHSPLNSYVSLDNTGFDDENSVRLSEVLASDTLRDPETIFIDREDADGMEYEINKALSSMELKVLLEYLDGRSYQEIADILGKDAKSVDNAIQRIKKKLKYLVK